MNTAQKNVVADVLIAFLVALVIITIMAGIVILVHLHIESGKYHHETRVGQLVDYLQAYEDCYVFHETDDQDSIRTGAVVVTLKCVKWGNTEMNRAYEYQSVTVHDSNYPIEKLNKLGADGWLAYAAVRAGEYTTIHYLRREVENLEPIALASLFTGAEESVWNRRVAYKKLCVLTV
jgi:hypothetical protein